MGGGCSSRSMNCASTNEATAKAKRTTRKGRETFILFPSVAFSELTDFYSKADKLQKLR